MRTCSERRILSAIAEGRPTAGGVFARVGARETRPFLGDTWLFDRITRLSAGAAPLLDVESAAVVAHTPVRLTGAGRRVLDGQDDNVALNGVERWIGGVHLTGRDVRWRWDEGAESIIGYAL